MNMNIVLSNKKRRIVSIITAIVLLAAQLIILYKFIFGIAVVFGENVSLSKAIQMTLDVFTINSASFASFDSGYITLLRCTLGIIYIAMMVIIIKNIITSISHVAAACKDNSNYSSATLHFIESFGSCFFKIVLFVAISGVISGFKTNNDTINTLIFCSIVLVISKFNSKLIDGKDTFASAIHSFVCNSLLIVAIFLLSIAVFKIDLRSVVHNWMYAVSQIKEGMDNISAVQRIMFIYDCLIQPIIYWTMMILALLYYHKMIYYVNCTNPMYFNSSKNLMICSIVIASISVAMAIYQSSNDPSVYWNAFRVHIPMLTAAIAAKVVYNIPQYTRINTNKKKSKSKS